MVSRRGQGERAWSRETRGIALHCNTYNTCPEDVQRCFMRVEGAAGEGDSVAAVEDETPDAVVGDLHT